MGGGTRGLRAVEEDLRACQHCHAGQLAEERKARWLPSGLTRAVPLEGG